MPLDHVVIAVQDLDTAIRDYHNLGFTVIQGGVHANQATHNALVVFANGTYLELLAATDDPPLPGKVDFSALLQAGEGLVGFALRSDDLEADAARLRADGFRVGELIPGERRRTDGTVIRWKLALLEDGFAPFLIQDVTPREWRIPDDPTLTTHANRATGLHRVEIAVRELDDARERYARLFGSAQSPTTGAVILRAAAEPTRPETLFALHLAFEGGEADRFPLEQTHGVRFQPISPDASGHT